MIDCRGHVCMNGNTILKLPLHMTSATQSHNIYSRDTLAEIHDKYYQGTPGTDSIYALNLSHWAFLAPPPPPQTFLSPAEDGFQKITLVWTVYTMFTRCWSSTASEGSDSWKEKNRFNDNPNQNKQCVESSRAWRLAGIVIGHLSSRLDPQSVA